MIADLDADTVDDGKGHAFVRAVVKELKAKRDQLAVDVESPTHVNPAHFLGRLSALRDAIRMIEEAKGKPE